MKIAVVALVLGALAGGADARDRVEVTPPRSTGAQEASVVAVVVDQMTEQPTVVLEGKRDRRQFAMVIGLAEATGIALPLQGIHWVIVGGESGRGARPLNREWVVEVFHQCRAAGVPFFFKQWGGKRDEGSDYLAGHEYHKYPEGWRLDG